MTSREGDLVALLDADYTLAATRQILADAMGLTRGQLDYLLARDRHPQAWEAWVTARARVTEDRCATRRCSMCRQVKHRGEFGRDRRDGCGIARRCKACHRLVMRAYRQ